MKKFILFLAVLLLFLLGYFYYFHRPKKSEFANIFIVNLYKEPMDVRLVESDNCVIYIKPYCLDFEPNDISNFATIPAGRYSAFWQFADQVDKGAYFYLTNRAGTDKAVFDFINGEYTLFFICTIDSIEYGIKIS